MRFLTEPWRRIGARLYMALGFTVLLTLVSSGVGVYYFERSGDLNFEVQSKSAPALESAWSVSRDVERLRSLGLSNGVDSLSVGSDADSVASVLARLDSNLNVVNSSPGLAPDAQNVQTATDNLAAAVDNIRLNRQVRTELTAREAELRSELEDLSADAGSSAPAVGVLYRALASDDRSALDGLWDEFDRLSAGGSSPVLGNLGSGEGGVLPVRIDQLALDSQAVELAAVFDDASVQAENAATLLVEKASGESAVALESVIRSFDRGRVLLAVISVASVVVATLVAWLWVGNGLVRRLSRLSERMRQMAGGDLEMPVPEVGRDEIGELANALEVFRQQALEVQRLNLVEQLYGELREANDELTRMQDRLVAQEKLAALGELVSGVAHEISNPLNFVKNFSEGSVDIYDELAQMLEGYRSVMDESDAALLEELGVELKNSLDRVCSNSGRSLLS